MWPFHHRNDELKKALQLTTSSLYLSAKSFESAVRELEEALRKRNDKQLDPGDVSIRDRNSPTHFGVNGLRNKKDSPR